MIFRCFLLQLPKRAVHPILVAFGNVTVCMATLFLLLSIKRDKRSKEWTGNAELMASVIRPDMLFSKSCRNL